MGLATTFLAGTAFLAGTTFLAAGLGGAVFLVAAEVRAVPAVLAGAGFLVTVFVAVVLLGADLAVLGLVAFFAAGLF